MTVVTKSVKEAREALTVVGDDQSIISSGRTEADGVGVKWELAMAVQ